jgi:hypothetical protein
METAVKEENIEKLSQVIPILLNPRGWHNHFIIIKRGVYPKAISIFNSAISLLL